MLFLQFILFFCVTTGNARASDISSLPLIQPISYERESKFSQYLSSKTQIFVGDVINISIGKKIKKQVDPFNKDLAKYFSSEGELDKLIESITTDINKNIIQGKLTDEKVISVYSHLGTTLIAQIANRIMEKEGITDESRRNLWVEKILMPFKSCIQTSLNSQYDADHCMTALTSGLVPNIGNALTFELSKTNLSSSLKEGEQKEFNEHQLQLYQICLKEFLPTPSSSNVTACTLKAIKQGLLKITDLKLADSLKSSTSSTKVGEKIRSEVWPEFNSCTEKVGGSSANAAPLAKQFSNCIDGLIEETGMKIVADKIQTNPSLQLSFGAGELQKISAEKVLQFKKCTNQQIQKDKRKGGIVDTSPCENAITNDLVYLSVLKAFQTSADEQVVGTNIDSKQLGKEGKKILDLCWKQNQTPIDREACLRKSLITFSSLVANKRLEFSIPKDTENRSKIKSDSLLAFETCLEKKLPKDISTEPELGNKMAPCSSTLLKSATGSVVSASVESALVSNIKDPTLRDEIRSAVLGEYNQCAKTANDLNLCTDEVSKKATLTIALAAGRASRSEQLPKAKAPQDDYLKIERDLESCVKTNLKGDELSKHLDLCKKKFVIEVARNLGIEKYNNTLRDLLGEKKFTESIPHSAIMIKRYNECLDGLYEKYQDVTICTDRLTRDGEIIFKENMNDWMSADEKDAATLAIKAQFVDFLPCLGGLLPSGGNSETAKIEKEVTPMMEIVARALAQFIEYSPENAKQNLDEIIKQFAKDMHETTDSRIARKNLIDVLYKNGAFDQFLKSYVKKLVSDSFLELPDSFLPKHLKDSLISKENFDAVFQGPEGKKIQETILEKLINPVVVDGKSTSDADVKNAIPAITDQVTHLLINSPHFGEKIIASQVQSSLDNMGALKGLFVKVFYGGKNALDWQKVRLTEKGKIAEDYIKENIMTPKFKMLQLSEAETKKYNDEAERLVTDAVKKYKEPK